VRTVILLLAIGIGLLAGGFYYHLFDDIIIDYFSDYILDTDNIYYRGSQLVWDAIPYVLMLMGLLCFILAGLQARHGPVGGGT